MQTERSYDGLIINMATNFYCAECGQEEGAVSLKTCMSCKLVKYCNAECQRNHWPKHKKPCKRHAAELRDEALFKDPPAKADCPICFLPMPLKLLCCISLPPATIESVPIYDYAIANEELAKEDMETYFSCCGKSICDGCMYSCCRTGNDGKCPFCNSEQDSKTDEEKTKEIMKRVEVNDPVSICLLANSYRHGRGGLQQDHARAIELYVRAAELGSSKAHSYLGDFFYKGGDLKKAKFYNEAAAMAGFEEARNNIGTMEAQSGNMERAVKHWMISASAGCYQSMKNMLIASEDGLVSRESIDSTLTAYNNSCKEMRSEGRDAAIQFRSTQ